MGINSEIADFLIDETPDKFKIDRMEFQNEKDLNQALNAARTVLNYIKIWFKVLSETDTGKDFVSGVSVQVNLLHNLTFKQDIDTTKVIDNESNNVKYQLWFDKLSKKHKNVVRYVKKHLDVFSKTRKWIENKTHKFNIKNYIKRMFDESDWEVVKKYKRLTKFAKNYSQSEKRIENRSQEKDLLSSSVTGNFLKRVMDMNNSKFNQFKKVDKNTQAYLLCAYQTIAIVFSQCEIRVDTKDVEAQYGKNTAKSGAILAFIKSHSKIKIGKDIMFKFKYNNHTQYGDNDTYNQWIDNRNILIISNNKAFADINWATLLQNAALINSKFQQYKPSW